MLIATAQVGLWDECTRPFLDSIKSRHPLRVLVIDNTVEGLSEEVKHYLNFYRFDFVENKRNIGFPASVNQALKLCPYYTDGPLLFANNDILFKDNCIDILHNRLKRKDAILVTPSTDGEHEAPIPNRDCFPTSLYAFMLYPKIFLEQVGWFDEGFTPAYYDDNDILRRIQLLGLKAIVYGPARVWHKVRATSESLGLTDWSKQRAYYIEKWGGPPGQETYSHPFNDPNKHINSVQQE